MLNWNDIKKQNDYSGKKPNRPTPKATAPKNVPSLQIPGANTVSPWIKSPTAKLPMVNAPITPAPNTKASKESERKNIFQNKVQENWLGKNVSAGLSSFNTSLAKTLDWILPTEIAGRYDIIDPIFNAYKKADEGYQARATEVNDSQTKQIAGTLVSGTVQALPSAIMAVMTGGGSIAGQATTQGLASASALPNLGKVSKVTKIMEDAVQELGSNPMFWNSFAQMAGPTYEKEIANGASETKASASAMLNGILGSAIEVSGGLETFKWADKGWKQFIRQALEEGGEEVTQYTVENIINKAVGSNDAKWLSMDKEQDAVINPKAQAEQGAYGVAIGGILGGGQRGLVKGLNAVSKPKSKVLEQKIAEAKKPVETAKQEPTEAPHTDFYAGRGAISPDIDKAEQLALPEPKYVDKPGVDKVKSKNDTFKSIVAKINTEDKADRAEIAEIVKTIDRDDWDTNETFDKIVNLVSKQKYADYNPEESYPGLKKDIRETAIQITGDIRQITDFNSLRKKAMGKVKLSKNGKPMDVLYAEWSEMYPDLFPETITHPTEQLEQVIKVSDSLKGTIKTVGDMLSYNEILEGPVTDIYGEILNYRNAVKVVQDQAYQNAKGQREVPKTLVKSELAGNAKVKPLPEVSDKASNQAVEPRKEESRPIPQPKEVKPLETVVKKEAKDADRERVNIPEERVDRRTAEKLGKLNKFITEEMGRPGGFTISRSKEGNRVKEIARLFGKEAYIVSPTEEGASIFNGVNIGGDIYINDDTINPLHVVFGHEFAHDLRVDHPEGFKKFAEIFAEELDQTKYAKYAKDMQSVSKDTNQEYDYDYILEEMIAEFSGEMFNKPEIMARVFEADRGLAKAIHDIIVKILQTVQKTIGRNYIVTDGINDLKRVEDAYVQLVKEARLKDGRPDKSGMKFSTKRDSDGKLLTKEQDAFFKDSKVRDADGNLLKVYHGSFGVGKFFEFNTDTIFLTTDSFVASKYSSAERIGKENVHYYSVYADLKNPLVVEASKRIEGKYDVTIKSNPYTGKNTIELSQNGETVKTITTYNPDDFATWFGENKATQFLNGISKAKQTKDAWGNKYHKYSAKGVQTQYSYPSAHDAIEWNGSKYTADELAKVAKAKGYDGVIINNVIDDLSFSETGTSATNVIAFESNQVKLTSNLNPTTDPDIRLSMKRGMESPIYRDRMEMELAENGEYQEIIKELEGVLYTDDPEIQYLAKHIKDRKGWVLGLKDIYRNMRDAFGDGYQHIKINYLDPFDQSKKDYVDTIKKYTDIVYYDVVKGLGIKKGSRYSKAVQWIGEGQRQMGMKEMKDPITGKTYKVTNLIPYTMEDLKKDFPTKWQDIKKASEIMRTVYDDMIDEVNESRRKIYPNNPSKLVPKRKDYFRHYREISSTFEGLWNVFSSSTNIDPKLAGISEFTKPKSRWASFMQERGMGKYKEDAIGGFLDYVGPASYSIHIDPHISRFRGLAKQIAEATGDTKNANDTIAYLHDFANSLAGKTVDWDRFFSKQFGRKPLIVLATLNNRVKKNQILMNLRSALSQVANVPLGIAKIKNPKHLIPGAGDAITYMIGANKSVAERYSHSQFISERYSHQMLDRFKSSLLDKPELMASWLIESADQMGTMFIWNSAYRSAVDKQVMNPTKYADDVTRALVAGRGIGEVPLWQQSKVFQMIAPFQLEVTNLWHIFGDMKKDRDIGGLWLILLFNWLFNNAYEEVTNDRIVFDPIDAIASSLRDGNELFSAETGGRLAGEVLSNLPLGQTIATLVPEYDMEITIPGTERELYTLPSRKKLFGDNDPTRYGSGILLAKAMQDPIYKLLTPLGGSQLKKTIEGATALKKGEVSKNDEIKFLVEKKPENIVKGLAFGQYAFDEAGDYYDKGRRKLTEKQSTEIRKSKDPQTAYETLMVKRRMESVDRKVKELLKDEELTEKERNQAITKELRKKIQEIKTTSIYTDTEKASMVLKIQGEILKYK